MNGILNEVEHARIIADMDRIALLGGIQPKFLYESMKPYCGLLEVEWVQKFQTYRVKGLHGLILEGVDNPDVKCQAIAGALIRNYIDARVIPLNALFDMKEEGGVPSPTVLLIPNLFVCSYGKTVTAWKMQIIYDLLLSRAIKNKPSVLWIESMAKLQEQWGKPFHDFLSNFKIVTKNESHGNGNGVK